MESCMGKSVMSGVMGFGMGGLFGMFMASVRYPPPLDQNSTNISPPILHPLTKNLPPLQNRCPTTPPTAPP